MTTSPLAAQLLRQGGALGFLAQLGKFLHRIVEDTDQQVAAQPRWLSLGGSPRWGRHQRRQLTQSCNWLGKPTLPSRIGGNSGRGIASRQACSVSVRVVDSRPQPTSGLFQSPMILAIARGGSGDMASADSLKGLMKWLSREEWRDAFEDVLNRHVLPACEKADIEVEEVISILGQDYFMTTIWGCAFEDFLTRELEAGRNVVDDYLKRRGWKESASTRLYMSALRTSVMSLYEVSNIVKDGSFLARDLVRRGEPILVNERSATRSLKQWDRIAARVFQVGSQTVMAGGVLPFSHDTSEELLKIL